MDFIYDERRRRFNSNLQLKLVTDIIRGCPKK